MQPLKLTIYGGFWDCQIYMGRLYLWDCNGKLMVLDWNEIVESFIEDDDNRLALWCAFVKGNYLYGHHDVFADKEFKELLLKKFKRIERIKREAEISELSNFLFGEQDNPFRELPTDTEISSKTLFGITDDGFWKVSAHRLKSAKYPVSSRPIKIWDGRLLSITANRYATIALSAGDEGLFQYDKAEFMNYDFSLQPNKKVEKGIVRLSEKHSLYNDWSTLSIFSSSDISESYLSLFNWKDIEEDTKKISFSEIISENAIFDNASINGGLSWGAGDKIYKADKNKILVSRFNNYAKFEERDEKYFTEPEMIKLNDLDGDIIEARVCLFGTVVECENSLIVLLSNGDVFKIEEPVVQWRIYPRSRNYENHLHVIFDDRLEIYSFNHDYFVDQYKKKFGLMYKEKETAWNNAWSHMAD